MRIKLLMLFFSISFCGSAQILKFSYDSSGNQTSRQLCLVNCSSAGKKTDEVLKEIEMLTEQDLLKFSQDDVISYYPNPVKEELYLKWQLQDKNYVSSVHVYNLNGQTLYSINENKTTDNQNLSFREYQAGVYIVVLTYSDGNEKSIKIIKN